MELIPDSPVSVQVTTCIVMNLVVGCHHLPPGPQPHTCIVINLMVGCHYFPPGPQLPSQPSGITALRPVPTYTAWWQRHIGVRNLPRVFTPWRKAETRTHDLLIASPTLYRNTTTPPTGGGALGFGGWARPTLAPFGYGPVYIAVSYGTSATPPHLGREYLGNPCWRVHEGYRAWCRSSVVEVITNVVPLLNLHDIICLRALSFIKRKRCLSSD